MKKHRRHRALERPATRREVLRIVQAARDEILNAIVHSEASPPPWRHRGTAELIDWHVEPERIERAVNGGRT